MLGEWERFRETIKEHGLRISHLADRMGMSRQAFDYALRRGLAEDERKKLRYILKEISTGIARSIGA